MRRNAREHRDEVNDALRRWQRLSGMSGEVEAVAAQLEQLSVPTAARDRGVAVARAKLRGPYRWRVEVKW